MSKCKNKKYYELRDSTNVDKYLKELNNDIPKIRKIVDLREYKLFYTSDKPVI